MLLLIENLSHAQQHSKGFTSINLFNSHNNSVSYELSLFHFTDGETGTQGA